MNVDDLGALNGKVVLLKSARDRRNPPTGIRGTISVSRDPRTHDPLVQIEVDFPQMFMTRAHHRTVTLTQAEVSRLLESEQSGTYSVTLPDQVDPPTSVGDQ